MPTQAKQSKATVESTAAVRQHKPGKAPTLEQIGTMSVAEWLALGDHETRMKMLDGAYLQAATSTRMNPAEGGRTRPGDQAVGSAASPQSSPPTKMLEEAHLRANGGGPMSLSQAAKMRVNPRLELERAQLGGRTMTTTAARLTEEGTSKFVQTEKWKIHYNEAGSGQPVIFIHGGGPGATGWSNFNGNMQVLSGKYRCLAVDTPGYGGSDPVAPHEPNNALALKLFMDALGLDKAAFVGNSMGGAATLTFAVDFNDRISHIVTMGHAPVGNIAASWVGGPGFGQTTEGLIVLAETRRDPTRESFRRLIKVMVHDDSFVNDELLEQRVRAAQAHPETVGPDAVSTPPEPLWAAPSVLHRLMQIDTPALIIHGRDDRAVPIETSLQTLTALKNSRMLIFNRCGHWAQLEHADEFNKQVDLFLSDS